MEKVNQIILITFALLVQCNFLLSQNPSIFQYYNSPIILNPALTGNDQENIRITSNFRNQWEDLLGYKSGIVTIDRSLGNNTNNYFGIGLMATGEQVGETNFSTFNFKPSLSLTKVTNKSEKSKSSISIGSSFGVSQKSIDKDKINTPTLEPNLNSNKWYFDISLGLNFEYIIYQHLNANIGISINHLNKPNISLFSNGIANLNRSTNIHAAFETKINESFSLIPNILFFKQSNQSFEIYGLQNRIYFNKKKLKFLQLGLQYLPNAIRTVIVNAETRTSKFLVSFSIGRSYFEQNETHTHIYELGFNYYVKEQF